MNWDAFTSTWLSVSAKGVDLRDFLVPAEESIEEGTKPYCSDDGAPPVSLLTLDHLIGVNKRADLHFAAETGLRDAFQVAITLKNSFIRVFVGFLYVRERSCT